MINATTLNQDGTGSLACIRRGNFASTAANQAGRITRTNTALLRWYADDAGVVLTGTGSVPDIRNGLYRTLLTKDNTGGHIRVHSLMGQVKAYDAFWNTEVVSAVHGRIELVRSAATMTLGGYGLTAAVLGIPSVSGAVTVNTNHVLAGVAAISDFRATLTQTGKVAGFYVGKYDTTNWSDATARTTWGYGLLIADSAAATGISIGICATAGLAITGASATGISITGAATDGIKIATGAMTDGIEIASACSANGINISGICADGIEISGAATTTGINISADCVTGITIGAQTTAGITIGTTATGISIGTATAGIAFAGTYSIGINFANATMTQGLANTLFGIGTQAAPKSVALTDYYLPFVVNLKSTANAAVSMQAGYFKVSTDGANEMASAQLVGVATRMVVDMNLDSGYSVQAHMDISGTKASSELIAVSAYGNIKTGTRTADRVCALQAMLMGEGTPGAVTGDCIVGYFVNAGNLATTDDIIRVTNQAAATCTNGINIANSGTMTTGIVLSTATNLLSAPAAGTAPTVALAGAPGNTEGYFVVLVGGAAKKLYYWA